MESTFAAVLHSAIPETFDGQAISVVLGDAFQFNNIGTENIVFKSVSGATASIAIPETLLMELNVTSETRIVYSVFLNEGLFLRRKEYLQDNGLEDSRLASVVVGVQIVGGVGTSGLTEPVQVVLLKHPVRTKMDWQLW